MQDNFKLYFERTGGFAGITLNVEIDSENLNKEELDKLNMLIDNAELQKYTQNDSTTTNFPDQFLYLIRLEYRNKKYKIEMNESLVTENIRPLIRYLSQKAISKEK